MLRFCTKWNMAIACLAHKAAQRLSMRSCLTAGARRRLRDLPLRHCSGSLKSSSPLIQKNTERPTLSDKPETNCHNLKAFGNSIFSLIWTLCVFDASHCFHGLRAPHLETDFELLFCKEHFGKEFGRQDNAQNWSF